MSDYQGEVAKQADQMLCRMRRWDKEQGAKEIMREYLGEQGLRYKDKTKLQELLDERHNMALCSEDENVKLKAIDSALNMAAGNEKNATVNNTQINIGNFLNELK